MCYTAPIQPDKKEETVTFEEEKYYIAVYSTFVKNKHLIGKIFRNQSGEPDFFQPEGEALLPEELGIITRKLQTIE